MCQQTWFKIDEDLAAIMGCSIDFEESIYMDGSCFVNEISFPIPIPCT